MTGFATSLSLPFIVAQAAPAQPIWGTLFMFAMMAAIFYLLVLMPTRKRQKKVQEFQASLKVSDRVITTGGIYGEIVRVKDASVQLKVADKVNIEVAKAAIGGYQGQDPVVQQDNTGGN